MAYATLTDILDQLDEARLIELTDDEGSGAVDTAKVTKAIGDADELIDGYVGSRYAVALDPVPPLVRQLSVALSIYSLYARRDMVPEIRIEQFKWALRTLELISVGKVSLGSTDPDGNPPEKAGILYSGNTQVFNSEKLDRY